MGLLGNPYEVEEDLYMENLINVNLLYIVYFPL